MTTETQQIRELFDVLYDFIGATLDHSVSDREARNALAWAQGVCERYRHGSALDDDPDDVSTDHFGPCCETGECDGEPQADAQDCIDVLRDGIIRLLDNGSIIKP